jgi:hypothetical protein
MSITLNDSSLSFDPNSTFLQRTVQTHGSKGCPLEATNLLSQPKEWAADGS